MGKKFIFCNHLLRVWGKLSHVLSTSVFARLFCYLQTLEDLALKINIAMRLCYSIAYSFPPFQMVARPT